MENHPWMNRYIVLLLADNDKYITYKTFRTEADVDLFLDEIEPLILSNIDKKLTLKERLKLAPYYFACAGKITDFEVIDLEEDS